MSNSPKTIGTNFAGPPTLYKGVIPITNGSTFRLSMWHINKTDASATFGWAAHLDAGTAKITAVKRDIKVENVTDLSIPGKCLAQAQLMGTLSASTDEYNLSTSENPFWSQAANDTTVNGALCACVMEFTITVLTGSPTELRIRSFVNTGSGNGSWSESCATADSHVRGWWPKSSIKLQMKPWDTDVDINPTSTPQTFTTTVCDLGGDEHKNVGFKKIVGAGHDNDTDNKGCYGVNLVYWRKIKNGASTGGNGTGFASLRSVDTGAKYWGAAHCTTPAGCTGRSVRKIPSGTDTTIQNSINPLEDIDHIVLGPLASTDLVISIATGGGAALPVALYLSHPRLLAAPSGDPEP